MGRVEAVVAKCGPGKEEEISLRVSIVMWGKGEITKFLTPTKADAKIT